MMIIVVICRGVPHVRCSFPAWTIDHRQDSGVAEAGWPPTTTMMMMTTMSPGAKFVRRLRVFVTQSRLLTGWAAAVALAVATQSTVVSN